MVQRNCSFKQGTCEWDPIQCNGHRNGVFAQKHSIDSESENCYRLRVIADGLSIVFGQDGYHDAQQSFTN